MPLITFQHEPVRCLVGAGVQKHYAMSHKLAELLVSRKVIANAMEVVSIGLVLGSIHDLFGSLDTLFDEVWEF